MLLKKIQVGAVLSVISAIAIVCSARGLIDQEGKAGPAEVDGEKLFLRECTDCHGEDGRGRMLKQPDFTSVDWHKTVTDDQLFKVIKFGREPMPFYAGALTDDQMRALVRYIRTLGKGAGNANAQADDSTGPSRAPNKPLSPQPSAQSSQAQVNNCSVCHKRLDDQATKLFAKSTHAKANIECNNCHEGNPGASVKKDAHANFIGQPAPNETIAMCGSCHTSQLAAFKTSLHFPERAGAPRMDCAQCHGAHTVGSPARDFSFSLFCTGCHGLEYLPELPREFQKMLALVDDEKDSLASLESSGRKASDETLRRRKEIRRMIGEIVHSTDMKGGLEKVPQILKLGDEFKSTIERDKR